MASEEQLRAAFVANFGSYVEWPASAFADADAPFVIGVMDDEAMLRLLEAGLKARRIQGRAVSVRAVRNVQELAQVHLLYLRESQTGLLRALQGLPVLTVGQGPGFLDRGGIIRLLMQDQRLRFEFNAKVADRSGLKVSAKLQQLALNATEEGR